jgi:DNA-binding MarR family transcriptional regulator
MNDLDTDFEEQAPRLLEAIRALVRRFSLAERADMSCCGMTVAQAATLEALKDSSLRLTELSRLLGITPSTLTRNLARLEERGLVVRETDPVDGRAQRVNLSPAGRAAADGVRRQEEAFAGSVLSHLPKESVTDTLTALDQLLIAIRAATENCCPGAYDHLMTEISPSPTHGAKHE